jgi:hypothetical protein
MSTDLQLDFDAFHAFLDGRIGQAPGSFSLEDALSEFRAYQRELADARAKVVEAKVVSKRGESAELDIDQVVREVTEELAAKGIRE